MKLKRIISKQIALRLLVFVTLVAGAVIFDLCHDQLPEQLVKHQQDAPVTQFDMSQVFFCNPASSFKISTGYDRLFSKILFTIGQDKFLSAFHNQEAYHLLKAESLKERSPQNLMVHFRKFIICHHSSSDDNAPIS